MRYVWLAALFAATLVFGQEGGAHAAPAAEAQGAPAGHESGAAEHAEDPYQIWWKWANFAILAGGLAWLAVKYGGPYFRERTASIQSGILEATRMREEAEARAADIERRVGNLSAEVEHLRSQSKAEMAREAERVRAETASQIAKIQAQAEAEIASAAKHATRELKAYAAQLALAMAERQIAARMDDNMQDGLAASFVRDLKNNPVVN